MTSTANPPTLSAQSTTTTATSYASAAGVAKPLPSPRIATEPERPAVVVGSSASQNGKHASPPVNVNGRPNILPAVPAMSGPPSIARGSSSAMNGGPPPPDHSRKSSVTFSAPQSNMANGGALGAQNIKFGFQPSPSSTPQISNTAPVANPVGNTAIPATSSPRPIPQVMQQSGGPRSSGQRMASGQPPLLFGSLPDEQRMPAHNNPAMGSNVPNVTGLHNRRESGASAHADGNMHVPPPHVRGGGYGGRGRGGYNNHNPQYNNMSGYPPNRPYPGPNPGSRGGMSYHQSRGGMQQYPNSPQTSRASPAMAQATMHQPGGTPTLPPAMMANTSAPQYYPQHMGAMNMPPMYQQSPQVNPPNFIRNDQPLPSFKSSNKKTKGFRRDADKLSHSHEPFAQRARSFAAASSSKQSSASHEFGHGHKPRRDSKRCEAVAEGLVHPDEISRSNLQHLRPDGLGPTGYEYMPLRPVPMLSSSTPYYAELDLSPESGTFEKLLTANKQQVNGPQYQVGPPQQYDNYGRPLPTMPYPYQAQSMQPPYMPQPPQPGAPPYGNQYYGPPQAAPAMSRTSSQVSEQRPASSTGPSQAAVIAQGTPQARVSQPNPPVAGGQTTFARPKKTNAIVIRNPDGKVVDFTQMKAPPSPVPNIQQSKTPPVAATPTPPPKSFTPQHTRGESASGSKTAEQLRNEFKDAVRKTAAEVPVDTKPKEEDAAKPKEEDTAKPKEDDAAKTSAAKEEATEDADKKAADKKLADEPKIVTTAAAEDSKKAPEAPAEEAPAKEAPAEEEAPAEPAPVEEAAAKAEVAAEPAEEAKKADPTPAETEEAELERMIREMEEEDRRREEEQAKLTAKKDAEKAEAKKKADEERKTTAADNDRKLREQEAEMERIEEERERQRNAKDAKEAKEAGGSGETVANLLTKKLDDLKLADVVADKDKATAPTSEPSSATGSKSALAEKQRAKPVPLNLAPIITKPVEAPQPSAAVQALKSARFLTVIDPNMYPAGILSPNPALNTAVSKKGKSFRYDAKFLLQFQDVFTDQPSTEFLQQVKSLIGDSEGGRSASARGGTGPSRQNSSRPGAIGGFPQSGSSHFGQFGALPGAGGGAGGGSGAGAAPAPRTLPAGTTSSQRFEMSRPQLNSIGSFGGGRGGLPGGPGYSARTNSNALPSPTARTSSKRGERGPPSRNATQRGGQSVAVDRSMPLTQGLDVKPIAVSEKGWKPTSIGNKGMQQGPPIVMGQGAGNMDPEMVQRKVKSALNKMTPEKFDKISDQILVISAQSKNESDGRTLRQVIQLTFEKATDEAHWASMYARFCKRMLDTISPEIRDESLKGKDGQVICGGALFRKYLLNRCQEDFERGWKVDLPEKKAGGGEDKPQEAELLSDEYYIAAAAKRRGLGLVQFIGELFKLGMLTERIMHACVHKLLEFEGMPEEAEVESLTKLLRTIGPNLDSVMTDKASANKGPAMMEAYFKRIQQIIDMPDLPHRLKFMLMDIQDLRRAGWESKDSGLKGPKTLDEIRIEAERQAAQKSAELARGNQRGGPPGGRMTAGRGDARGFGAFNNPPPNTVNRDDLQRLKGSGSNRSLSQNHSFGPTSMFASRSSSGRAKLGPPSNFARGGDDSNSSSRVGTPPVRDRETSITHANAFGLLADNTGDHPGSPPSTAASPAITQAKLAGDGKKED